MLYVVYTMIDYIPALVIGGSDIKQYEPKMSYAKLKDGHLTQYNNVDKEKITTDSEFRIGSLTKIFTATSLLIAQEKGLLDIDADADKYLKVKLPGITIRELMNHEAGVRQIIVTGCKEITADTLESFKTATDVIDYIVSIDGPDFIDPSLKKGKFTYSNVGYILLGAIIEKISKMSWIEFVYRTVIKPLKLTHTGMGKTDLTLYNNNTIQPLNDRQFNEIYLTQSAGALYSSINDLHTFSKMVFTLSINQDAFKNLYFFQANGLLSYSGGNSWIKLKYDNNNKMQHATIVLRRCSEDITKS
jgi:CubicO group peptidase (beta-lactamase class C family)